MGDRRRSEGERPLRQVLSRDEIRELLSPLPSDRRDDPPPVLILTDRPEDAETVARSLTRSGVSHVPASHRFAALDWFRQRRYGAVVASTRSLQIEAEGFVERLREVDPAIPIFLVCDPDEDPRISAVDLIRRPVTPDSLVPLLTQVVPGFDPEQFAASESGARPAAEPRSALEGVEGRSSDESEVAAAPSSDDHRATEARARDTRPTPRPFSTGERSVSADEARVDRSDARFAAERAPASVGESAESVVGRERRDDLEERENRGFPDPLRAVAAILDAKLAGGTLEAGLRRWIHEDPAALGLASLTVESASSLEVPGTAGLGSSGFTCRAVAASAATREEVLRVAGTELSEAVFDEDEPVRALGRFLVFAEPGQPEARWAVYAPRMVDAPVRSQRLAHQLVPLVVQLRRVPAERAGTSAAAEGDARRREPASGPPRTSEPHPIADEADQLRDLRARLDAMERRMRDTRDW